VCRQLLNDPERGHIRTTGRATGFTYVRDFTSTTDTHNDGTPVTLSLHDLDL